MLKIKAALGQNALFLFLCFLCIAPSVNGTGAECLEGFGSLSGSREEIGEGQFIIPSLTFTCDGNITQLMFVARGNGNAQLKFQAWRPLTRSNGEASAFSRAATVDVQWTFGAPTTTVSKALTPPLPVSASYVLGVHVSNTNRVTLLASELNGGFTMYSDGDTGNILRTSNLATSTTLSVFVSVSFETPTLVASTMVSSSPVMEMSLSPPVAEMSLLSSMTEISSSSPVSEMSSSSSTTEMSSSLPPTDMSSSSSSPAEMDSSPSTATPSKGSNSASRTGDSAASQAGGSVFPPGGVAGIVLAVCLLLVAVVMGMICFGVFFSRCFNKCKLDHNGYTSASFSKESGEVMLLRASPTASSVTELLPYEEVKESNWSTGAPGFPLSSSYEPVVTHQDRLGNEWFVNPHGDNGPSHLYESVTSHSESSRSLPVYSYVPTLNARLRQGVVTELSQVEQDNIYTELESVYEGVARMEQAEQPFSLPPERLGPLYDYLADKKCIEIPWSAIGREEALGAGEFGEVFKGVLETPYGPQDVAVKMLKDGSNEEQKAKFLQEGAVMAQFRHPHIVRLLGAVTINDPCALVLELLPKGDLRKYLLAQRPEPGHLPDDTLPVKLLSLCCEVADGLKYLSNKGFIHCDLAARNILLDKSLKCKIADFGMSKNVESDYYMSTGGKVPIRWTAPECLFYKKYCAGSDVWSFGMLLFEIWSLGHQPFPNLTPLQVVTKLQDSKTYVQPPPPGCPRDIYQLMVYCWNRDHHQRPSATNVGDVLSTLSEPLLSVPEDEVRGLSDSTRARQLGAPLEYGVRLYTDLQQYYNTN